MTKQTLPTFVRETIAVYRASGLEAAQRFGGSRRVNGSDIQVGRREGRVVVLWATPAGQAWVHVG